MEKLTKKQALFAELLAGQCSGNLTEAARLAGYKGNNKTLHQVAKENLDRPHVMAHVDMLKKKARQRRMKLWELRAFWADMMGNVEEDAKNRIKASELYARSIGAFVERSRHEHKHTHVAELTDAQLQAIAARAVPRLEAPVDAIDVEYAVDALTDEEYAQKSKGEAVLVETQAQRALFGK